jgi:hypothetical protein
LPKPDEEEEFAGKWRLIKTSLNHFTPLAPLRFAGPFGPNIIHKLRPDMMEKFAHLFPGDAAKEMEMVDMSGKKAKAKTKKKAKKKERKEKKNGENGDEEEQRYEEQTEKKKKEKEKEDDDDDQGEEETEAEAEQHREEQRAEAEWEMVEEGMMQEDAVKGLGKEAKISSRVVIDYLYHINARTPATGEIAFRYTPPPLQATCAFPM